MPTLPLFEEYPRLKDSLPHITLGELPTPVQELPGVAGEFGIGKFYIKRDDASGAVYGGNKVRKLEFLLADALRSGAKEVMTFGCAGSNHATATAVYSHQQGMRSINMLLPQPNAASVRRNLLLSYVSGAELHHYATSRAVSIGVTRQNIAHQRRVGQAPYIIPAGGSSALGATGFVNAAFELRMQIAAGHMPEPDFIYVPGGTVGTGAGLIAGLRAAGLRSQVVVVRVTGEKFAGMQRIMQLLQEVAAMLYAADGTFPNMQFTEEDIRLRHDFYGGTYALYTRDSVDAVLRFRKQGIKLEGTYTGKAAAALLHDARQNQLKDKVVLFWNTHNSRDFTHLIENVDYRRLPKAFHRYFEEDVQPLDAELTACL
jgi:D-cysteine desulfhydrase